MRPGARVSAMLASAVVALLAGCSAAPGDAPRPAGTVPAGVEVAIVQLRGDVAARQAQVQVVNGSGAALVVGDVRVSDPRLDGEAVRVVPDRASRLAPGGRVDIRVQLPEAACPAGDGAGPIVELDLVVDGAELGVAVPASDPLGFLGPLHERDCRAAALADAAALAFTAFAPSPPGDPARLTLTVTPTGGAATIAAVQETNLLSFDAPTIDGALPLDLEIDTGDTAPLRVDLPLVPSRCDAHAVQEDKRGTIFDVRVAVGGEEGEIELFAGDEMRGRILSWVAEWCGFGD